MRYFRDVLLITYLVNQLGKFSAFTLTVNAILSFSAIMSISSELSNKNARSTNFNAG